MTLIYSYVTVTAIDVGFTVIIFSNKAVNKLILFAYLS